MITIEYITKAGMCNLTPDSWKKRRFETFNMANDWLRFNASDLEKVFIWQTLSWEIEDVEQLAAQELTGVVEEEYALPLIGRE